MFSERSKSVGTASSIQQNELVYKKLREGLDPIILSYGEAPFLLPEFKWDSTFWEDGCHYTEGLGHPLFRTEIANYELAVHGVQIDPDNNVLVSAGSKIISYFIALAFLDPGKKILLHEPSWVSYQEHARLCGGSAVFVSFEKGVSGLKAAIDSDDDIKIVYLNNPNNPRGLVYGELELRDFANFCCERSVVLAVDESYSDFVLDEDFFSCANLISRMDNVVVFNSLSKNFGLSGWRLGYCIASKSVIGVLNKFNQHLITCAPTCLQLALVGKLVALHQEVRPQVVALNKKRKHVLALLDKYDLRYLSGSSTFYVFVDVSRNISDTQRFVIELLESDNVSLIPGGAYGASTSGFLRLSFAIEPLSRIENALRILSRRLT